MQKIATLFAVAAIAAAAFTMCATESEVDVNTCSMAREYAEAEDDCLESTPPMSGMYFTSECVTEEYEYDDAFCLNYYDPDANMFDVEICVDPKTYKLVRNAIESGVELYGKLVLNEEYSFDGVEVFTYEVNPELDF